MKIVIRADASQWIGSGHIMRCLVLAKALRKAGHEVVFASLSQQGDMITYIREQDFDVVAFDPISDPLIPQHNADYAAWLQRSEAEDSQDFITNFDNVDMVIIDHYGIGCAWERVIRAHYDAQIVAIDDLIRAHDADIIIDQTLGRCAKDYEVRKITLSGSDYALLDESFAMVRNSMPSRRALPSMPKVLVTMGAIDQPNATLSVLKVLAHQVNAKFTVLLSARSPNYQQVKDWCKSIPNVNHIDFCRDMAALMAEHDIAIGAPGTTSWERACLGLPSIIIPLADNQQDISRQLVKEQAAILVTVGNIRSDIVTAYRTLVEQWSQLVKNNLRICDGQGVSKVVATIEKVAALAEPDSDAYRLSLACEKDISLVYQWQCHPQTRKFALNPSCPTWQEHEEWMARKINSLDDYFYIIKPIGSEQSVGVVRLDKEKANNYLVSIFIAPDHYGKGIASQALKLLDKMHPNNIVHATVLQDNLASQKLFEQSTFKRLTNEAFVREAIELKI